jgi:hypothetical protein
MAEAKNSRKSTKEGFDDTLKVNWLKEGQVLEIEKRKGSQSRLRGYNGSQIILCIISPTPFFLLLCPPFI